ncbi:UNVERIFIED_CONTAM: hypothetical protein Sradi_4448800 [Sesamum radiatum]|uniref:Uncharacterized protein n=1 Tax=Sesamum radiatum TaxID=300843 RepID=A0AAW2NRL7_SESRA
MALAVHNNSAYQAPQPAGPPIKTETVLQAVSAIPNVYTNGASSVQPSMQIPVNMAGHAGRIDVSGNMLLAQNSNTGMMHGMNGMMIKSEGGYAGDSQFMFGADNNLMEPRNGMGEASASPFDGGESSSKALNEAVLDSEMNSFGFLGQIPRSFSLSDLTADFLIVLIYWRAILNLHFWEQMQTSWTLISGVNKETLKGWTLYQRA